MIVVLNNFDLGWEDVVGDTTVPLYADKPAPEVINFMPDGPLGRSSNQPALTSQHSSSPTSSACKIRVDHFADPFLLLPVYKSEEQPICQNWTRLVETACYNPPRHFFFWFS